jgi:hypothetical protein
MDREELLKLEHATLVEEFKITQEDMLFYVDQSRKVATTSLTAATILAAASPFIIQTKFPTIFLVASLVFYPLA